VERRSPPCNGAIGERARDRYRAHPHSSIRCTAHGSPTSSTFALLGHDSGGVGICDRSAATPGSVKGRGKCKPFST
jgi:hypothetical protein